MEKSLTPWSAPLIWISMVPFFLAIEKVKPSHGALLGWIFGLVQFGGILYWIVFLQEAQYLSGLAWVVLVFYLSLYFLLFGWFLSFIRKYFDRLSLLLIPCLWIVLENIRGTWPFGGFPWGQVGYACAPYPAILTLASCFGVLGLTFFIVWFNSTIAKGIHLGWFQNEKRNLKWILTYFLVPAGILGGVELRGVLEISHPCNEVGTISILQPNIDQSVKWDKKYETNTFTKMQNLTQQASAKKPNLILWPETAAPSFLLWSLDDLTRVENMVFKSNIPALVGCLDLWRSGIQTESAFNAAIHFDSTGKPVGVYRKRHLVPFGEYVPFQKYLSFLGPVVRDLGNFEPGPVYCRFTVGKFSYTPLICYEAIFPQDVRLAFQTGADVLVNISNDAWYGRTASAYQHAMMAVVRSAEERKPLFRAANTGISLITDPYGRLLDQTPLYQEAVLTGKVLVSSESSWYYRFGDWIVWFGLFISLGCFLFAVRIKLKKIHG